MFKTHVLSVLQIQQGGVVLRTPQMSQRSSIYRSSAVSRVTHAPHKMVASQSGL